MSNKQSSISKLAFRFVLTIGIVNLLADMTYEGARSITGPFLSNHSVQARWQSELSQVEASCLVIRFVQSRAM